MILTLVALAAAAPSDLPADSKQRMKCVREEVIGSLVQTRRVCHTLAEWEAINRARAENARDVVRPDGQMTQTNGGGS